MSLDRQISEIDRLPSYGVIFNKSRGTSVYRLKRVLNSYFKRANKTGLARIKGKGLVVKGDIDETALRVLLDKSPIKYELRVLGKR